MPKKRKIVPVQKNIFWRVTCDEDGNEIHRSLWIRFYDPSKGFTVPKCIKSKNVKDAERELRKVQHQIDEGEEILAAAVKRIMTVELFELLRDDYKRNGKKDLYSLELRLDNHMIPFFKNYRAVAVNTEVGKKFADAMIEKGLKPATVNRMLSHLSYAFRLGYELRKVSKIPLIKRFKENNRRKGFFEKAEFQRVYVHLPEAIKPIAELGYFTGMRQGELLSLKWDQVQIAGCCIRLEETKNGDPREIHYAEILEIKSLIDTQYERKLQVEAKTGKRIEHLFFNYNTGKQIKDIRACWKTACAKSGVKRLFHDLRRTAVRNLVNAGVPRHVAMLISGHETESVFERYNISDPKDTRAALGKVSQFNKNENPTRTHEVFDQKERVQ